MWRAAMILLFASACSDPTLAGTYAGDGPSGNPMFPAKWTVTIASVTDATPRTVQGSYTVTGIGLDTAGTVSGTFVDPDLTLELEPTDSAHCGYDMDAEWTGDELRATYNATRCFVVSQGMVVLKRR
jgi:hypothetical protein